MKTKQRSMLRLRVEVQTVGAKLQKKLYSTENSEKVQQQYFMLNI